MTDTDPLDDLDENARQALADVGAALGATDLDRRKVLAAGASVIGGVAIGGAASTQLGGAAADPSTSDGDGDIGGPNDRRDVFADGLDAVDVWTDSHAQAVNDLGTVSGTTSVDVGAANMVTAALGGDTTLSFANAVSNPAGNEILLKIHQDGSTEHAITWPSVTWIGGGEPPDPATGEALEVDLWSYDGGSSWYGGEAGRY